MNAVFHVLLHRHRLPLLLVAVALLVGLVATALVVGAATDPGFSPWLTVAGSAVKYWLGAFGILLVVTHLRHFVAAGLTRRAVLAGGAALGALLALGGAVLVPLGHGLEEALIGDVSAGYPPWSPAVAVGEFGRLLPICLAFLVSGTVLAAAFYRFGTWRGLPLAALAGLPLLVSQELLRSDGSDLPYPAALAVSLAVTLLGAVLCRWLVSDVAIRRPATP
ncbi:hypothetical protein [Couchioplanes azureus]|uniref:hypothetical protein n=1 Tax=Couchioplanes caeruleus TaxID=56438 RepID=UPI001670072B|nr:hypothetical protein [Couchioplanes caeruleus]GGQ37973.1 hypothetical protein GCM10010166_00400 [Couchioplanes caeruleus subsp. azureus]